MKANLHGLNIAYRYHVVGNSVVTILLHGWGGNLNSFRFLESHLEQNNHSVLTLDFPGFGGSDLPREDFSLDDYVKIVLELIEKLGIKKCNIVAHSFGGRVALLLASQNSDLVQKLVLVDSAGIKPKFSLKKKLLVWRYKILKKLKSRGIIKRDLSSFGSEDYKAMPDGLKPVFNRIVNIDLSFAMKEILAPTLIVWGKNDEATPYYMAKRLNRGIKNSAIVALDGGHFAYIQNANKFLIVLDSFLANEKEMKNGI